MRLHKCYATGVRVRASTLIGNGPGFGDLNLAARRWDACEPLQIRPKNVSKVGVVAETTALVGPGRRFALQNRLPHCSTIRY